MKSTLTSSTPSSSTPTPEDRLTRYSFYVLMGSLVAALAYLLIMLVAG